MLRTCFKVGLAVVTLAVVGCGGEDNPEPVADQSSPTAGLDSLKLMQQGGTGPKTAQDLTKKAKAEAKAEAAKPEAK